MEVVTTETPEVQWLKVRDSYFTDKGVYGFVGNQIILGGDAIARANSPVVMNNHEEGADPENLPALYVEIFMHAVGKAPIVTAVIPISELTTFNPFAHDEFSNPSIICGDEGFDFSVNSRVEHQKSSAERLMTYRILAHTLIIQAGQVKVGYLYQAEYGQGLVWAHTRFNFQMNKNGKPRFHSLNDNLNVKQ